MNRRWALIALAVVAVGLVTATILTLRSDGGNGDGRPVAGRLGPTPGPDSDGHIRTKRVYLADLARRDPEARGAGLVSFSRLMPAQEASTLLGGMRATAAFVRFPAGEPEAIQVEDALTPDVAARATELADITRAEIEALEGQGSSDREPVEQRRQALAGTTPECACVYAVAVEGVTVRRLAELQGRDEVRLVDVPEPLTDDLGGWELTAIFPV